MNKALVNSLTGMPVANATEIVSDNSFIPEVYEYNEAVPSIARPGVVLMWERNGIVEFAQAGDPTELED